MTVDISVLIGGEAGQGIQTVGLLMARTCHRAGLYVMAVNDFESRIPGRSQFYPASHQRPARPRSDPETSHDGSTG